jgi:MFS family permease
MDIVLIGVSGQAFFIDIEGWTLLQAGWLGMFQGIFQNMGAIVWGIMADRGYMSRRKILCFAAAVQGLCTLSLAFVSTIPPMWPIRIANGFFLAALRPISNGIVADLAPEKEQGHYFGLMQGCFGMGLSLTGMVVGPVAESSFDIPIFGDVRGWRLAFCIVASFAVVASFLALSIMPDVASPKLTDEERAQPVFAMMADEIKTMIKFMKYPTFVLMIGQGIFGSIPWIVLGNLNLYARLCGFEQWTLFWLGFPGIFGSVGGYVGGMVSDFLTSKIGCRGRPATAMMTVGFGIPIEFMLFYGIAPGSALNTVWVFFGLQCLFNFLAIWAQPACNFPVLGQIVVGKDRNKVMCWEMAFENTMATIIGSNAVPLVVRALGGNDIEYNGEADLEAARTLGLASTVVIVIPWTICFFVYSGMLWSFPIDYARVQKEKEQELMDREQELVTAAS